MPFKLTKDETKTRDALIRRLSEASDKIAQAVDAFNAALETAKAPVEEAIAEYNEIVAEAQGFAEDVASRADNDMSEKSDRWLESERGQAAEEFKNEWENLSFDELELELPEPVDFDPPTHADDIGAAPEELAA